MTMTTDASAREAEAQYWFERCQIIADERDVLALQIEALTSDRALEAAGKALKAFLLTNNDQDIETKPELAIRCILVAALDAAREGQ